MGQKCPIIILGRKRKNMMWHYTDINALYSMLSNKSVWMTDIRYLNDTSEYFEGVSEFKAIIPELLENNLFGKVKNPKKAIDALIELLLNNSGFDLSINQIFTFSFSQSEDQLSQWRAYGKYAIEFDTKYIEESFGKIHRCIYSKQEKKTMCKRPSYKSNNCNR